MIKKNICINMAIIKHRKSAVPNKVPAVSGMTFGEIFVNYASGDGKSFLATLKNDESVAQFMEKGYNDTAYASKQLFKFYTLGCGGIIGKLIWKMFWKR